MVIETECPSCGKGYRVKDELDGRKIRCKKCGKPFKVEDFTAQQEDAWDADYADDEQGDEQYGDDYGAQTDPYAAPASMPGRKKKRSGGQSRSQIASSKKPAWQFPVGILGILVGVGLTLFGIWAITQGERKAGKATYGGIFLTMGAARLAFSGGDDE